MALVLVVDDEPSVGATLERLITRDAHSTVLASTGSEALELLDEMAPDVAFVDLRLADMSGLDLIASLRRLAPELVVLVISALTDDATIDKAFELGAFGYVTKPFDATDIRINLSNGLARRDLQRSLETEKERFRSAFEDAPVGMAIVSLGADMSRILSVNAQFADMVGRDASDVASRRLTEVLEDLPLEAVAAMTHGHEAALDAELSHLGPGDSPRWVRVVAKRLPSGAQGPTAIFHVFDRTAQKDTEDQLRRLARDDPLTGLPNRATLLEALEANRERARTDAKLAGLLFVDIDRFKTINDELGHAAGDEVLVMLAQMMRRYVRPTDIIGRLGGDEFVVVANRLAFPAQAFQVAERIRNGAESHGLATGRPCTVSIGVAVDDGSMAPDDLMALADDAMYRAKAAGRNRVVMTDGR